MSSHIGLKIANKLHRNESYLHPNFAINELLLGTAESVNILETKFTPQETTDWQVLLRLWGKWLSFHVYFFLLCHCHYRCFLVHYSNRGKIIRSIHVIESILFFEVGVNDLLVQVSETSTNADVPISVSKEFCSQS